MKPAGDFLAVEQAGTHWSKVPAVWLVIGIPATAVVVGFIMLSISIASFDGVVVDDYYKKGKEINRVLYRDNFAAEKGITAQLTFNTKEKVLIAKLASRFKVELPQSIVINLLHPTQSNSDVSIHLQRTGKIEFQGAFSKVLTGRWIVQMTTSAWRLSKTIRFPVASEVLLQPIAKKKP